MGAAEGMIRTLTENPFACSDLARRIGGCALAVILSLSIGVGSFAEQKIPPAHIVLVKASTICGAEDTYSVVANANAYTDRQLEWMRTVFHFALNVDSITFPDRRGGFDFASDTGRKVSQSEMAKLLANSDFSRWVGSEIVKGIRAVSAALLELDRYRASLEPGRNSSAYLNDAKPVVQKYWDAETSLIEKLTSKLKITTTDTGADCN